MQPQKNLSRKDNEDGRERLWLTMEPQQLQELLKELQMVQDLHLEKEQNP
jgi:hypothetical protein